MIYFFLFFIKTLNYEISSKNLISFDNIGLTLFARFYFKSLCLIFLGSKFFESEFRTNTFTYTYVDTQKNANIKETVQDHPRIGLRVRSYILKQYLTQSLKKG